MSELQMGPPGPDRQPEPRPEGVAEGKPHAPDKVVPFETARDEAAGRPAAQEATADTEAAAEPGSGAGGAGGPTVPTGPEAAQPRPDFSVAKIRVGGTDNRNERVERVFFKRHHYAIYQAGGRVAIHFADDPVAADGQIGRIAALYPLRDRFEYLVSGLKRPRDYREQIANGFRLSLEGQPKAAEELIAGAIQIATEDRARIGRLGYLTSAGLLACLLAAVAITLGSHLNGDADARPAGLLALSAGGGAFGALLSIAMAIRNRTVAPDSHWVTNLVDGAVRVMIGVLSAGALYLLLASGFIKEGIAAGDVTITGRDIGWQAALLVGFAAGFLERLVPDLLAKKEAPRETAAENSGTTAPG